MRVFAVGHVVVVPLCMPFVVSQALDDKTCDTHNAVASMQHHHAVLIMCVVCSSMQTPAKRATVEQPNDVTQYEAQGV
jgi:hypothetical protein